jgi:hypothetical protein
LRLRPFASLDDMVRSTLKDMSGYSSMYRVAGSDT